MYKRWTPSSRRDRRARGSSRRRRQAEQGVDKVFVMVIGAFLLVAVLFLLALSLSGG